MSDATIPWEAFDITHPDHEWWVKQTGKCLANDCVRHITNVKRVNDELNKDNPSPGEIS